jgi:hypothetical protein
LTLLVKAVLDRGAGPVVASASKKTTTPTLAERQAVWEKMESDEMIRIRLTDSVVQADHAALAVSCKNANLLYNKQFAITGAPTGTAKAAYITWATAIAADSEGAKRASLVAPGVYDEAGTLRAGSFAAAVVASELAKNNNPANDLDLWPLILLSAIEKGADGLPVFRRKVVTGVAVNDFEDLLQGGVSPLMVASAATGGVQTTHLRTVFTTDGTFDSLMTRIIIDQLFLLVKNYILEGAFLRAGNTQQTRDRIRSGVDALLNEHTSWLNKVPQPDGTDGYNVAVTSSPDQRQLTISYQGEVVRGISTVQVAGNLTITV